jgi:ribonuclease HII
MLICGIDEAGRGPVIGPMVMAGVVVDEKDHEMLRAIGAKDSKLLTPLQRERLFKEIVGRVLRYKIVVIGPQEIDKAVMSKGTNLNWLEAEHQVLLVNELAPGTVYIDCPSPNIKAYSAYIHERLKWPDQVKLVCAHHADRDYPVVSAASILAKVTRDEHIERIKKEIGIDFGSGYAADPRTVEFVKEHWQDYPDIFRHSWAAYKRYATPATTGQTQLGTFARKRGRPKKDK